MIPVPASWLAAADGTHAPRWSVELQQWSGTTLVESQQTPVVAGELLLSGSGSPTAGARLSIPATGLPSLAPILLMPWEGRAVIRYTPDGDAPRDMAVLHISRTRISRPGSVWDVEAVDASALIAEDRITARRPWTKPAGSIGTAIRSLIARTLPAADVQVSGAAVSAAVPDDWTPSRDPWAAAVALADLAGAQIVPDRRQPARFLVRDAPQEPAGTAVDALRVGDDGNVTGYSVDFEQTYNAVAVVYKRQDGTEVVGWWTDTRTSSPTNPARIGHHITRVVELDGSPTQQQADMAAQRIGWRETGWMRGTSWTALPRPWLDPGDTISVTYAGGPVERHLVESVSVPLDGGAMQLVTRNNAYDPTNLRGR